MLLILKKVNIQMELATRFSQETIIEHIQILTAKLGHGRRDQSGMPNDFEAFRVLSYMDMHGIPEARRTLENAGLD